VKWDHGAQSGTNRRSRHHRSGYAGRTGRHDVRLLFEHGATWSDGLHHREMNCCSFRKITQCWTTSNPIEVVGC